MSAAYAKGIGKSLLKAQISYDRFHVVALANAAMDAVRREEMRASAADIRKTVGTHSKVSWTGAQFDALHWLRYPHGVALHFERCEQATVTCARRSAPVLSAQEKRAQDFS